MKEDRLQSATLKNLRTPLERLRHTPVLQVTCAGQYQGMRLCNHSFWRLSSAAAALDLKVLLLWGMDRRAWLICSSGADAMLCPYRCRAVPSQAHCSCWSFWIKNNNTFFLLNPSQVSSLNGSTAVWPVSWRAHLQMFFPEEQSAAHEEFFAGLAGSKCHDISDKQLGKFCFVLLTRSEPNYPWIYTGGVD